VEQQAAQSARVTQQALRLGNLSWNTVIASHRVARMRA
jgi:hypothetical protein